jgi:hypothetical protein
MPLVFHPKNSCFSNRTKTYRRPRREERSSPCFSLSRSLRKQSAEQRTPAENKPETVT